MTPTPDPLLCTFCRHEIRCSTQPAPALDFITWELAARFWIHYRCGNVGCEIVEQHEHGGQPMREMTADEIAAALAEPQP